MLQRRMDAPVCPLCARSLSLVSGTSFDLLLTARLGPVSPMQCSVQLQGL